MKNTKLFYKFEFLNSYLIVLSKFLFSAKMKSIIQQIDLADVLTLGKERFNTNNHWIGDLPPEDYSLKNNQTDTKNWIDYFKKIYIVINFDISDLNVFKSALTISRMRNKISKIHEDEIDGIVRKYIDYEKYMLDGCFIRSENVSLKYGKHSVGPYFKLYNVIESILTAPSDHTPVHELPIKLYLIPWIDIIKFQEFRVFVHNKKITAISQQHLYESNQILNKLSKDDANLLINKWIDIINNYFFAKVQTSIDIDSYVYDFAILKDDQPYFIEINPFGKEYSSGSSLFHWIIDEDILYGKKEELHFRYCV